MKTKNKKEVIKLIISATIINFLFFGLLLVSSPVSARTCTTASDCPDGERCEEIFGEHCVNAAADKIFYITGRCTGPTAIACPPEFNCQSLTRGKYCITNEPGMATTTCPAGQEFIDGRCQVPPVGLPSGDPTPRITLENPLGGDSGETSVPRIIGNIVKTILTIVGALALAMFVYGGFTWLTSGGSSEKVKKGKDILMWATIGLVIIFASYTLVDFLLRSFGV